jgi:predicted MFS family arabinose efflux permease
MGLGRATTRMIAGRGPGRSWQATTLQLAVALAFADASIVVLALPRIVDELHTSISAVTWVIMAYNLALIVGVLAYLAVQNRFGPRPALLTGLALFGLASIGSGAAGSLGTLVAMRCLQGAGGALLLCGSLPLLAGASDSGRSPAAGWSTAAAVGAAIGPAAGGLLTQAFDWRAIFLAQAPAAALAAAAVIGAHVRRSRPTRAEADANGALNAGTANAALLLLSAGLIGALFLVVVLLIDVWQLSPAGAAAVVSAIPLATIVAERLGRSGPPIALAGGGACLLALGLAGIAFIPTGEVGLVVLALLGCGAGLGLGFTSLTAAALGGSGSATTRAGRTVAARDAGLVVGLLILTPIFVGDLNAAPQKAIPSVAGAVAAAPIPESLKGELGTELIKVYGATPQGSLPDLEPAFARVRRDASGPTVQQLGTLESQLQSTIETTVTHSFRRSFLFSALFALLVLPVLGLRLARDRRHGPRASGGIARSSSRRQSASRRAWPHPG